MVRAVLILMVLFPGAAAAAEPQWINNDENRLPSAFEFGSHLGAGLRLARNHTIGLGLQHLSNAGIKQPNGGIDLLFVQYSFSK